MSNDKNIENEEKTNKKKILKSVEGEEKDLESRFMDKESNIMIEPFNLIQEREQGSYDKDGNYSWNKEEYDEDDEWADALEDSEIKKRTIVGESENTDFIKNSINIKRVKPNESNFKDLNEIDLIKKIIKILKPKESITEALKRLKPVKIELDKKNKGNDKNKKISHIKCEISPDFDNLTDLSYYLSNLGFMDAYTLKREDFYKILDKNDKRQWLFKWDKNDNNIHGPYPTSLIREWIDNDQLLNYNVVLKLYNNDLKSNKDDIDIFDLRDDDEKKIDDNFKELKEVFN
jgi:hypothetical protein